VYCFQVLAYTKIGDGPWSNCTDQRTSSDGELMMMMMMMMMIMMTVMMKIITLELFYLFTINK